MAAVSIIGREEERIMQLKICAQADTLESSGAQVVPTLFMTAWGDLKQLGRKTGNNLSF
jgi:hypothetical protein